MKRTHSGFTLVEMLVALSVAALLVSLVYGAVRVGQRSANALGVQAAEAEVMRIGWQFLHHALAQARPVVDPLNPVDHSGFRGGRDTLSFIANVPAYVGMGGLMRISLRADRNTEGYRLILTRARLEQPESSATVDTGEQAVLVDHLDSLNMAYFGRQGRGAMPAWHGSWEDPRMLPNLVRISVKPLGAPAWPILIASPMMGSDPLGENEMASDPAAAATPGEVPE